jgi:hypothetical protein
MSECGVLYDTHLVQVELSDPVRHKWDLDMAKTLFSQVQDILPVPHLHQAHWVRIRGIYYGNHRPWLYEIGCLGRRARVVL